MSLRLIARWSQPLYGLGSSTPVGLAAGGSRSCPLRPHQSLMSSSYSLHGQPFRALPSIFVNIVCFINLSSFILNMCPNSLSFRFLIVSMIVSSLAIVFRFNNIKFNEIFCVIYYKIEHRNLNKITYLQITFQCDDRDLFLKYCPRLTIF